MNGGVSCSVRLHHNDGTRSDRNVDGTRPRSFLYRITRDEDFRVAPIQISRASRRNSITVLSIETIKANLSLYPFDVRRTHQG